MTQKLVPFARLRLALAAAGVCAVLVSAPHRAAAQPAVDASVVGGVDTDMSAIARLSAGGLWAFGKFAPEAHIGLDGFLRIDTSQGIAARSFDLIDVGMRYGFLSSRFVGPFVTAGGSFGLFTGKPHERKLADDPEVCAAAPDNADGTPATDCVYRIDKNLVGRFGLGWGFPSGAKTTVAVRVDVNYWWLSLSDYDPKYGDAANPNLVPRPQATWTFMVGLEFIRFR